MCELWIHIDTYQNNKKNQLRFVIILEGTISQLQGLDDAGYNPLKNNTMSE